MLRLWKDCESKLNIFITFKENLNSEELKRIMDISRYEGKQEHNTNRKKKKEGDLEKE